MFIISDFVRVLRAADINVSTVETIEAGRMIDLMGFADRELVKTSLSQILAKSESVKETFDDCFENYFTALSFADASEDGVAGDAGTEHPASDNAGAGDEGPPAASQSLANGGLSEMVLQGDNVALAAAMARAASEVGLAEAKLFTQSGLFTRKIMESMGLDALEQQLIQFRREEDAAGVEALEGARRQLFEMVRDYVDTQIKLRTANAGRRVREDALSRVKLSNLDRSDMRIMRGLVEKLAKRLATAHSRRRTKAQRGVVDIRKTLRRNQSHDGLLIDLVWKTKKLDRPRLITMCDVSGSVAAYAKFLLMFLYNLDEVIPKTRSFVFSNQCGEVTDLFQQQDLEKAMAQAVTQYGGGSTDYGQSLSDLAHYIIDDIDHRTTLMILGDGRSNFGHPGHDILRDLAARARRVIWLNPEPQALWNTGDSEMHRLGAYCHLVQSCNTIRHLERVLDNLLRAH
jgi:uncharacterized protein with von Willebrand factor type A (vWA) domain